MGAAASARPPREMRNSFADLKRAEARTQWRQQEAESRGATLRPYKPQGTWRVAFESEAHVRQQKERALLDLGLEAGRPVVGGARASAAAAQAAQVRANLACASGVALARPAGAPSVPERAHDAGGAAAGRAQAHAACELATLSHQSVSRWAAQCTLLAQLRSGDPEVKPRCNTLVAPQC